MSPYAIEVNIPTIDPLKIGQSSPNLDLTS